MVNINLLCLWLIAVKRLGLHVLISNKNPWLHSDALRPDVVILHNKTVCNIDLTSAIAQWSWMIIVFSCQWISLAVLSGSAQERETSEEKSGFNQRSYPVTIITVHLLTESWSTFEAKFTPSLNNSLENLVFSLKAILPVCC